MSTKNTGQWKSCDINWQPRPRRGRGVLLALCGSIILCHVGCNAEFNNAGKDHAESCAARGLAYQKDRTLQDMEWLADNFLAKGLSKGAVEKVMGEGSDPAVGPALITRVYPTHDGEPTGGLLLVHYVDGVVESWEWASE